MKRLRLLLALCMLVISSPLHIFGEKTIYDEFRMEMDTLFQGIDKTQFKTGILKDYGFHFLDLEVFNGNVIDDSNLADFTAVRILHKGLCDSKINEKAEVQETDIEFGGWNEKFEKDDAIVLLYEYEAIDSTAFTVGALNVVNGHLVENREIIKNLHFPIYVRKKCFVVSPVVNESDGGGVSIKFSNSNLITNTDKFISKIELDFCDGKGFRNVPLETPYSYKYDTNGEKQVLVNVSFSSGENMKGHFKLEVSNVVDTYLISGMGEPKIEVVDIPATAAHSGGQMQIIRMQNGIVGDKFLRPLMIVGDIDFTSLLGGKSLDLTTVINDKNIGVSIIELSKLYDVIYLKYNDSLDDLLRNGELFREAVKKINESKFIYSDEIYVIGLGIGGVISKIGVNKMELSEEKHGIHKLIAVNSPFRGLNVPIGFQALPKHLQHFANEIKKYKPELMGMIDKLESWYNSKAISQLLIYRLGNLDYENPELRKFLGKNEVSQKPNNCELVSIVNSRSCFPAHSKLFDVSEKVGFDFGIIAFCFKANISAYSIPFYEKDVLYDGNIQLKKIVIFGKSKKIPYGPLYSTENMHPIDGASGASVPLDMLKKLSSYAADLLKVDRFCLIPKYSALDIDRDTYFDGNSTISELTPFDRYYQNHNGDDITNYANLYKYIIGELLPNISGENHDILDDTEQFVDNVPVLPIISFKWWFKNGNFKIISSDKNKVIIRPVKYESKSLVDTIYASVSIPFGNLKFNIPGKEINTAKVYIGGDDWISKEAGYYEVSNPPSGATDLRWSASEGVEIEEVLDGVKAYVNEYVKTPSLEVTMEVDGTFYKLYRQLHCAKLDSVRLICDGEHWNKNNNSNRYAFRVAVYPNMTLDHLGFCWNNDVVIKDKDSGDAVTPSVEGGFVHTLGGGLAKIESAGDVGICPSRAVGPIVTDSLRYDGGSIRLDSTLVIPRLMSSGILPDGVEIPPAEPMDPTEDFDTSYPNTARVTMPYSDYTKYSDGFVTCQITDDFGGYFSTKYYVYSAIAISYGVAPNPTSSAITVSRVDGEPFDEQVDVNLYSTSALVRTASILKGEKSEEIDVSGLPDGTYIINVVGNKKINHSQVVVIKH